jgi:hypothetical protein
MIIIIITLSHKKDKMKLYFTIVTKTFIRNFIGYFVYFRTLLTKY